MSLRTLVLEARYPNRTSYYDDWADAFDAAPYFETTRANVISLTLSTLEKEIDEHDLVILLHSCTADTVVWVEQLASALAGRKQARLIAFVGNEYNSPHAPMGRKLAALRACRPDIIATQLLEEAGKYLYDKIAQVISIPHALNPTIYSPGAQHRDRPIDIGVRNFRYSPLLGDDDRNRVIDFFQDHAAALG